MMKRGPWPVGARLPRFYTRWQALTSDPWILSIVREGYRLQFLPLLPTLTRVPLLTPLRGASKEPLLEAIRTLHAKKAVVRVLDWDTDPGFYSRYFLSLNKDGSLRPILNLQGLNQYIAEEKFRMETLDSILSALEEGD